MTTSRHPRVRDRRHGAAIDEIVGEWIDDTTPGAVIAVVEERETVHHQAYGLARLVPKRPMKLEDTFDLASCSKMFTATCVMLLADRGELSFDDDVRDHLPELRSWKAVEPVTIEDLLVMRSGLPEYDWDDPEMAPRDAMLGWLRKQPLGSAPGSRFEYVNTNYALLGYVVSARAGKSLGEVMREELFEPLGMANSYFFGSRGHVIPQRVQGYRDDEEENTLESVWDAPGTGDGNVFTCAGDLVLWAAAQEAGTLVEQATLERQVTAGSLRDGSSTGYGYGLTIDRSHGSDRYSHDGCWYGTSTWYSRHPEAGLTVIVLSNWEETATTLGEKVSALYLKAGKRR